MLYWDECVCRTAQSDVSPPCLQYSSTAGGAPGNRLALARLRVGLARKSTSDCVTTRHQQMVGTNASEPTRRLCRATCRHAQVPTRMHMVPPATQIYPVCIVLSHAHARAHAAVLHILVRCKRTDPCNVFCTSPDCCCLYTGGVHNSSHPPTPKHTPPTPPPPNTHPPPQTHTHTSTRRILQVVLSTTRNIVRQAASMLMSEMECAIRAAKCKIVNGTVPTAAMLTINSAEATC